MARPMHIEPTDIIEAAKQCIQQRGLANTTLKEVAAEAGVTQGTIYYHFKTKEELMLAVLKSSIYECIDLVEKAWVETGSPATKLASALDVSKESFGKRDDLHRLVYNMIVYGLQNVHAAIECGQLIHCCQQVIERCCLEIHEAIGPSRLPAPAPLSRIIYAFFLGLSMQSLFDPEVDIDEDYDSFTKMILDLMKCRPEKTNQ